MYCKNSIGGRFLYKTPSNICGGSTFFDHFLIMAMWPWLKMCGSLYISFRDLLVILDYLWVFFVVGGCPNPVTKGN